MVKQRQSLGAWRGCRSYKEVAEAANAEEVNQSSLELDVTKHKANRIVQVKAFEEDLKSLFESYVGETYDIDQVPGAIKESISVLVDGLRFQIHIVEESSGETIFARGGDRERALKADDSVHPKYPSNSKGSGSSSAIPCSLLGLKDSDRQGVPKWDRSISNVNFSKLMFRNDDSLKNQNVLGQSHHMALAERNFRLKSLGEQSSDGHMPSQGVLEANTFMEDETPIIKKGEK
ncbi:hypothetical protein Ancab_036762 [Ancistrocladus abbreviatus]